MGAATPTRLKVLTPKVRTQPRAAGDMPQTPYLNLNLPPTGFPSWGPDLNQNFSSLDAAVGSLQRSYQGDWVNNRVYAAGQIVIFNGGVFISLTSGNINLQPDQHPEAWGPMGSATSITYPPAGVAVSAGSTGWSSSIPVAAVPRTDTVNAFMQPQQFTPNTSSGISATAAGGLTLGWNTRSGNGETDFVNSNGGAGGGFNWYNVAPSTSVTSTTPPAMTLDSSSKLLVPTGIQIGPIETNGIATFRGQVTTLTNPPNGTSIGWNMLSGTGETDFFNSSGGGGGGFFWFNGAPGTVFNSSSPAAMFLDSSNNLHVNGGTLYLTPLNTAVASSTLQANNDSNLYISAGTNIMFNWNSGAGGMFWGNGHGVQVASLSNLGSFVVIGAVTAGTVVWAGPAAAGGLALYDFDATGGVVANAGASIRTRHTQFDLAISTGRTGHTTDFGVDSVWDGTANGDYRFWSGPNAAGTNAIVATISRAGNLIANGNITSASGFLNMAGGTVINGDPSGNIAINNTGSASCLLNWNGGGAGVIFGNGHAGGVGGVTSAGVLTAVTKSFRIVHPLDSTKILTHGSVEGPEFGVYYRGEGQTEDGRAMVTLPDYFEALTRPEGRTVQLTALYDEEDEEFGQLAASRVVDGQFRVRSSYASQKFYWEVKAVRADVNELEVVTEDDPDMPLYGRSPENDQKA
jgi:hypothetical protein